ncbi:MAG: dihydrodipicolinate synthase family protein [Rhodothermales bacterium]
MTWNGIYPAVTTQIHTDGSLDAEGTAQHIDALIGAGVHGIVTTGSLGESSTLTADEKQTVLQVALEVSGGRVPVLMGVAEHTTADVCAQVKQGTANGADGFMVLPPMIYPTDRRETLHHFRTVARASEQPIMVYNNPVGYRVDVTPEMFEELADETMLVAIKESSDNVRRLTDIVNRVGDRYDLFTGVDNLALESLVLGAVGWVAGLVGAFPKETVAIYDLVQAGRLEEARTLYRWFMPLLHLDVSTKLVQNIKLVQQAVGYGTEHVREPRLPLVGAERAHVEAVIEAALAARPAL